MTRINTNLSSLTAQNILSRNQQNLQTSLTRLSTGLRINSGKDDPGGLIASEVLRSEITSINASISNSQRANNIVATADAALSQVSSLLNDIRGLVQASANKGAISAAEIAANQVQVDSALESITRIGQTTVFGGDKLLNGSKAFNVTGSVSPLFASTADIQVSSFDPSAATAGAANDVTVALNQSATKKSVRLVGDSQVAGGASSLRNLSLGSSTRTTTTVVANDHVLGNTASLADLSTGSTNATRTVTGNGGAGAGLEDLTGTGAQTVTFTINAAPGYTNQTGVVVNVAALQADSTVLATAINQYSATTGVVASTTGGSGADITLTSLVTGTTGTANLTATAASVAGDVAAFNSAVGSLTAGTDGAIGTKTTVFTITGNKGAATVSTAALSAGGFIGNDVIINNNSTNFGINALRDLINTRTGTTGVTASVNGSGNLVLTSGGVGSTSLAGITAGGGDAALLAAAATKTTNTGVNGTSNQTTLSLTGDLGTATVVVNNDAVINDSSVLADAINRVTSQTGISATTAGGNLADVTLSSRNYGSAAVLTASALTATSAADVTLFNGTSTQSATAGRDATGTVSTNKGTGSFTGKGEVVDYIDGAVSFTASTDPSGIQPTLARTTIVGTGGAGAGINNLTGTAAQTITFQLTGKVNGNTVTTNLSAINVAALQGDSRILVDAINATSLTSGVKARLASTSAPTALGDIVLESTTPGAGGSVGITATAASVAGDVTVFNNAATQTSTAPGLDAPTTATASFDVSGGALFQIGPTVNFANQVNVNITSLDLATLGRNVTTTGNKSLANLKTGGSDILNSADLSTASDIVSQAISQIATLRGKLGALQKNVLESNIASQKTTLEQLTSAQSNITDADFASETASLTRAQILVQAGTSVLSIANSSPQAVLNLLPRG